MSTLRHDLWRVWTQGHRYSPVIGHFCRVCQRETRHLRWTKDGHLKPAWWCPIYVAGWLWVKFGARADHRTRAPEERTP